MNIVVMGGSFNPPTVAHLRLMRATLDELCADMGIFVPAPDEYVKRKMKKSGTPDEVLSEEIRMEMLSAMAEDDPRIKVDDLEYHCEEKPYTYETMCALQEKYPDATLWFLSGGDKVGIYPKWHRIAEFLASFRIIVVKRDGEDPERDIEANDFLRERRESFYIMNAPEGVDGISSSAVRASFRSCENGAREMCHPRVNEIFDRIGGMPASDICGFFGEYRFLSNFWNAPFEYDGVTYKNSEAAFQAQKCVNAEERAAFSDMEANVAKRAGRKVLLRADWEDVKVGLMEGIVRAKFTQNADLAAKLIATGKRGLYESNSWHDVFWGVDIRTGKGENNLGKILMKVRAELAEEENG